MTVQQLLSEYIKVRPRGTLVRLAEETGLSAGHLHDLVKGRTLTVSVETARALQKATGIRVWQWLGLEPHERRT